MHFCSPYSDSFCLAALCVLCILAMQGQQIQGRIQWHYELCGSMLYHISFKLATIWYYILVQLTVAILWYYIMYHIIYIYSSCTSFLLLQDVGSDISSITQEISDPEPKMTVTIGSLEKPKEVCIVACWTPKSSPNFQLTIHQQHCYQHST